MINVDEKIKEIIATVFDIEPDMINTDSNVDTVEAWDSVNHMHLVVALEEEFGITFEDEEAVELMSFELISSYIKEKVEVK